MAPPRRLTWSPARHVDYSGSAARYGVYGNRIFVDGGFRFANPCGVITRILPVLLLRQDIDVASIGWSMARPGGCSLPRNPGSP